MGTSCSPGRATRYLSCKSAGAILDLSDDSVRRLVKAGKLDGVRVGQRCIRVSDAAVYALLEARKSNKPEGGVA